MEAGRPRPDGTFAETPFMVFWETTQACDLACKHCRADARPERDPEELTRAEGFRQLEDVHAMGCPLVVLTGGDPAKRPDLLDLVRHGSALGLRVALTPSATPLVTRALLEQLADAGLARLAVSLDGATAASHDGFRGVTGSFARTFEILRDARAAGLTLQVNTTVTGWNVDELEQIADQLRAFTIQLWGVFFLVPTGRGEALQVLEPDAAEAVLERLVAIARTAPFDVKTTAAPHFRRVLLQHQVRRREIVGIDDGVGRAPRGVNDGQGIVFVSHRGEIYPSGFLPLACGSVRREGLAAIYRRHPVFTALRDLDALGGKCGPCEFRRVCGGSRARAYAMTGDLFAEEPACAYVPRAVARAS
jgi:AdoMet-dependent heme synthase